LKLIEKLPRGTVQGNLLCTFPPLPSLGDWGSGMSLHGGSVQVGVSALFQHKGNSHLS